MYLGVTQFELFVVQFVLIAQAVSDALGCLDFIRVFGFIGGQDGVTVFEV